MKRLFLLILFSLISNAYASFSIIDRLASPFIYDDDYNSYASSYSDYSEYKSHTKGFTKKDIPFLVIMFVVVLLLPGGRRRYHYYDYSDYYSGSSNTSYNSLGSFLAEILLKILRTKTEKAYRSFNEEDLIKREDEVKEIMKKLNMDIEDYRKLAAYTLQQYMLMLSGEKNDMSEISTEYIYQKYLKEITELYQKEIKAEIEDFKIEDVKVVNIRYTEYEKAISVFLRYISREYYIDITTKNFISGERFPVRKCIFLTFIYDGAWKLSLVERKGESYVMKLENLLGVEAIENNEVDVNSLSDRKQLYHKEIPEPKLQLMVAEYFFNIYSWWQNPENEIKAKIDEVLLNKIIQSRRKINNNADTEFKIDKFQIISIDFITREKTPAGITRSFIARINFSIKGRFVKNSIVIVDSTQKVDEMWQFEIENNNIILKDILKKFTGGLKNIEPNPLQIEWYI